MRGTLFALALVCAPVLPAATIDLQLLALAKGASVTRTIVDGPTFTPPLPGGATPNLQAGLLLYTGGLLAYCLEPQQSTGPLGGSVITYTYDPTMLGAPGNVGGMLAPQATRVSDIRKLLNLVPNAFSTDLTDIQAAAIQISIWEILRETEGNPYDVLSGNVFYTSEGVAGVFTQANTYLSALNSTSERGSVALLNSTFQDLVISDIPEPGTYLLMGSGLILLAAIRRSRS